ncbi:reverse transcriptase [Tanacetum coccineum]
MVIATRQTGTSQNTMNEELEEMIGRDDNCFLSVFNIFFFSYKSDYCSQLATSQEGILVQQNYHTTDINILKNEEGTSRPIRYTRMTKLEFPKFSGERGEAQFNKPAYPRTQTALPLPASSANKVVGSTSDTPRRQLSRKEYEEKRAKNLCFYYDQKYAPDESDSDQDIVYNVEEDIIQPHISLNALAGITTFHTMRINGRVGKVSIHILVDSGSTYNFMDVNCAKRIRCRIKKTYPLQVDVPGGNKMVSAFECKDFIWSLQGMEFKSDVVLLHLGGCEMVL